MGHQAIGAIVCLPMQTGCWEELARRICGRYARRASSTDFASGRDIEEIRCDDDVGAWYVARCRDAADGTREVVLRTNGVAILGQGLHLERSQLTAR